MGFSRFQAMGTPPLLDQKLDLEIVMADGRILMASHFIMRGEMESRPMFAAVIIPR